MENIHKILEQYWGYSQFRPLQEDIINSILSGKDTLALLPTGGGKSICFQVPAMALEGLCIVVTPLIALMKDQVENLRQRNIPAAAVYTGLSRIEIEKVFRACEMGEYKFLYVSPERLQSTLLRNIVSNLDVSILAIDEAHCISQWGYDFRPPYLKIAEFRKILQGHVPVLALTATATPEVVEDIQLRLEFEQKNVFRKSFIRDNLIYVVQHEENKNKRLLNIINKIPGTGIVYVRNRRKTVEMAEFLKQQGVSADFYHAGLDVLERERKQDEWKTNKIRIIVSTNAFGMGIDKPDVRFVVHLDVPDTLEAYFQEAGRGGRDGKPSYAVLLYEQSDLINLEKNFEESYPPEKNILQIYQQLCSYYSIAIGEGKGFSADFDIVRFANYCHLTVVQVHHAISFLVRVGWILLTDADNSLSKLHLQMNADQLNNFQDTYTKQADLIKLLLRSCPGLFTDFVPINEEELAKRHHTTKENIIEQLKHLEQYGVLSYLQQTDLPKIYFLENRVDSKYLRIPAEVYNERKKSARNRLDAVENYVKNERKCRSRLLVEYFGEKSDKACGFCDNCISKKKVQNAEILTHKIQQEILELLQKSPYSLDELITRLPFSKENIIMNIRYLLSKEKIFLNEKKKYQKK